MSPIDRSLALPTAGSLPTTPAPNPPPPENVVASAAAMVESQNDGADSAMEISAGQKMISAISGSLLTSLLVTPLDVVRVRLQSQSPQPHRVTDLQKLAVSSANTTPTAVPAANAFRPTNLGVTACCREVFFMNSNMSSANAELCLADSFAGSAVPGDCAVEQTQSRNFTSTFDGMRKIARNEGFTTLWRGLSPTLAMAVPGNIIYFTGYEWLRSNQASPIRKISNEDWMPLTAGSTARVLAAAAVGPIELFRTRLQASTGSTATGHLKNTFSSMRSMVAEQGYSTLWRGLPITLWRDVPFSGLYWFGYELIRGKLTDMREEPRRGRQLDRESESRSLARARSRSQENHTATFMDSFTAGAISGAFASIVTMPFDVGKTRTQVYRNAPGKGSSAAGGAKQALAPEEQSMVRFLWHIFRTEGMAGLWKGWIPRTLKVAPSCAIMISSYEVGKRAFRGMNERKAQRLEAERGL